MSGKSRRGKRLSRSKRKGRKVLPTPVAAKSSEPAPVTQVPKPKATPVTAAQAPDVATELRRIGILAGIILVILVVLALIFA